MNIFIWFRAKVIGPQDHIKIEVVKEIERQVSKLNGETDKLTYIVRGIKSDRAQNRGTFIDMLDSIVQLPHKDDP